MFEGLFQPTHLIIILVIILLLFGPGKLPDLGKSLGKGIREFRSATTSASEDEEEAAPAKATAVHGAASVRCAECGEMNPPRQRFCGKCGHSLEVAQTAAEV
jgi:sec-independent protein translocase protein TatA